MSRCWSLCVVLLVCAAMASCSEPQADAGKPTEFIGKWAKRHQRPGEVVPTHGCAILSESPIRYHCLVTFRDDRHSYKDRFDPRRYRGYVLLVSEPASDKFKITHIRRRAAGPRAYD
jgi:hypothetical protein